MNELKLLCSIQILVPETWCVVQILLDIDELSVYVLIEVVKIDKRQALTRSTADYFLIGIDTNFSFEIWPIPIST